MYYSNQGGRNLSNLFTKKVLSNGINIYIHSTTKFKTTTFGLFIHQNLQKDIATKTALLPFVLKRGSESFPTSRKLNLYLENLYGANMGGDILKRGETHIMQFFLTLPNEKYLDSEESLNDKCLYAFKEMILNPVKEGSGFKQTYVNQEKDVLKRNIESLYNDKFNYAVERCFQEMCKDEPFNIYKYGNIADLEAIDNINLYDYYSECLAHCPIDIFVLGDVNEEEIFNKLEEYFNFERSQEIILKKPEIKKEIKEVKYIEEKQDVYQSKLSMGFRTNTVYGDKDYYALMVYNGILGGGAHSKLFQNVREKASIAYYIFSRIEKTKGLMLIASGIDFINYEKALDIINQQLDDIRNGKISDYEFDSTVKLIVNSLKESADSPAAIISLYLDGIINNIKETTDDMIQKVENVTKEDVINVAQKIQLDTVYFLNRKRKER